VADIKFTVEDRRKKGYFTVDNVLIDVYGKELGPYGIAVYIALARFADSDSECWPSHMTIANRTGMSRRQVVRMVAMLTELQIISVTPRFNEKGEQVSSLYVLLDIIDRGDSQSRGGVTDSHGGSATQSHRTNLNKKHTPNDKKKEEKRNYRPDEYSDIILG
jgi:hypothetical protein